MLGRKTYDNVTHAVVHTIDGHPTEVTLNVNNTYVSEEVLPTMTLDEVVKYLENTYDVEVKY